jgi:hypothetical protein
MGWAHHPLRARSPVLVPGCVPVCVLVRVPALVPVPVLVLVPVGVGVDLVGNSQ